jgi:signal transduction histidine kinase/nitrogen-specific signal transduction histidine kinase
MKNLSIQFKIMSISIFVIVMFTFFMAMDSINTIKTISNNNIKKYKQEAYDNKKEELKSIVSIAVTNIKYIKQRGDKKHIEDNLKQQISLLFSILNKVYERNKNQFKISDDKIKEKLKFLISNAKYGDNGYYWVNDGKGRILSHPVHPSLNGQEISNIYKGEELNQINSMLKQVKQHGSGFMHYKWKRKNSQQYENRISYIKVFKPYGWVIGTGVYIKDVEDALKKEAIETIKAMKYGKNGYFWINDTTPKMIMNPILPELDGKDLSQFKDKNGNYIFKKMVEISKKNDDGGFIKYMWLKPDTNKVQEKISYVKEFKPWNWIIGSGAYVDDIEEQISFMKKQTDEEINKIIKSFFIKVVLAIIFIVILIHLLIEQNIVKPIEKFKNNFMSFFDYVNNKKVDINLSKIDSNDEIGKMSKILNKNILVLKEKLDKEKVLKDELKDLNNKLEIQIKKEVKKTNTIEEKLFESEKLASMGEMIGNIAHQWRQPLSVISTGATGLILQKEIGILSDQKIVETCNSINDNAQYLSKTIDDFTNFIKGDSIKKTFSLEAEIDSFLKLIEGSVKNNNIKIILDLQKNISIDSYENELTQCFMNLYNNAKDALVENVDVYRYIFIKTKKADDKVIIQVKDNAKGIPEDIMPKIFDPYFTTKHQSKGTGLGLHMTYNLIVNGMDGKIEVENTKYEYEGKEYKGAMFTITLPIK